uniref:RNase H type-1 domain-containing protein n=1 Tax=Brassica oleracea var. oleracea TaxID=109376 RepID=A0A0D3DU41_BRAOL
MLKVWRGGDTGTHPIPMRHGGGCLGAMPLVSSAKLVHLHFLQRHSTELVLEDKPPSPPGSLLTSSPGYAADFGSTETFTLSRTNRSHRRKLSPKPLRFYGNGKQHKHQSLNYQAIPQRLSYLHRSHHHRPSSVTLKPRGVRKPEKQAWPLAVRGALEHAVALNINTIWLRSNCKGLEAITTNQRSVELYGVISDIESIIVSSFSSFYASFIFRILNGPADSWTKASLCNKLPVLASGPLH